MKKYIIFVAIFSTLCSTAYSQSKDSTISVDLLSVPVAPAFTILGVEPTSIEEPTTPTDLLVSVRNSTGIFKNFPTDYALSFAPGWVFGGSKINYQSFASGKNVWQNIKQSSIFSLATRAVENEDSTSSTQIGIGIKFSIFRGSVDEEYDGLRQRRLSVYNSLSLLNEERIKLTKQITQADSTWVALDNLAKAEQKKNPVNVTILQALLDARDARSDQLMKDYESTLTHEIENIKYQASKIKFERSGFKLDLGLGLGYDFASQNWDNGKLFRYGIWLNGGKVYQFKNKQSFVWLLTSRLLMFPNEEYKKENTILTANNLRYDFGGRLIYKLPNKLSVSTEALSRTVINNSAIPHTYRLTFNFDYQLLPNQVLTLSLGRDFDGTVTKDGNLIAALNFIMGFGKQRPF
jgi:hypothetical protein